MFTDNFLINNVSDMYVCGSDTASRNNFYVWFGTSITQEDKFQSIPPYFMDLALTYIIIYINKVTVRLFVCLFVCG